MGSLGVLFASYNCFGYLETPLCMHAQSRVTLGDPTDWSLPGFSTHGSGRSPGEGNGNSLQYSCLVNPTDRGAWRATVHRVAESESTEVT